MGRKGPIMNIRMLTRIMRVAGGAVILGFASFFIINQMEKWALISASRREAGYTQRQAQELVALGFSEKDEIIDLKRDRTSRLERRADAIGKQRVVLYSHKKVTKDERQELQDLITINKKMLHSYVRDLQDYRKLGVPEGNNIVCFAQKKVVRLSLVLAELERQFESMKNGVVYSAAHIKRLKKLVATNRKSIDNYKKELRNYYEDGLQITDPKIAFIKVQLTDQFKSMDALELILEQS